MEERSFLQIKQGEKLELLPLQQYALDETRKAFQRSKRIILQAGCGFGKTVIATQIARNAVERGKTVLFIADRIVLCNQTSDVFKRYGVKHGVIQSKNPRFDIDQPCQVCSIQTLKLRGCPKSDVIIIDEAHVLHEEHKKIMAENPDSYVLGLTASPYTKGLGKYFDFHIQPVPVKRLIDEGYLVPFDIFGPSIADLSRLKVRAGEFTEESLVDTFDKVDIIGDVVKTWKKIAPGKKTIVFGVNVAHIKHLADQFNHAGISACQINAYQTEEERQEALDGFILRDTTVLCSVEVATKGFDCLDAETEILTQDGWRGKGKVLKGDLVYALNRETLKLELVPVEGVVKRVLNSGEKMAEISSQRINIRVTEGHEFHYRHRNHGGAFPVKMDTLSAKDLSMRRGAYLLPVSAEMSVPFAGVPLTDDEIRLVAWFVTDGGFENYSFCISQSKEEMIGEIRELLKRIGLNFTERIRLQNRGYKNGRPLTVFCIPKGTHTGTLSRKGWSKYSEYFDKNVSPKLHRMTNDQFRVFWMELLKGDGSNQAGKHGWLWCENKSQSDAYTMMAVTRGMSASVATSITPNGYTMYRVGVHDRKWLQIDPCAFLGASLTLKQPEKNEEVWCVRNQLSTLVTRRQGKIVIIGNCPEVEVAVLAVATKSMIKWTQTTGRALRTSFGKERAIIIDMGGNCERLGFPDDYEFFGLDDGKKKKPGEKAKKERLPKACPSCDFIKPVGVRTCPACGFTPDFKKDIEAIDADLRKLQRKAKSEYTIEQKQSFLAQLNTYAESKNMKRGKGGCYGWAIHAYIDKFGCAPSGKVDWNARAPIGQEVQGWITHKNIAYAYGKAKRAGKGGNKSAEKC